MVDSNISRVIVVQGDGKPIGIISNHDVLPASTLLLANKTTPYTQYWIKRKDIENNNKGIISRSKGNLPYGMKRILLAEDIMKFDPIIITDYADLIDAALIMRGNRISGLPVVDSNNRLVGIIIKTDITRAVADGR